jgi:MFS family permease
MGARQTFGLFVEPFAVDYGIPMTLAAFAIALHNLVWGVAQPVAGAAADRFGAMPVVTFGAFAFAAGLVLVSTVPSGPVLVLGMGTLVGVGISCMSFGVVLPAVGRALPDERRSVALGWVSAGGSLGQVLMVPLAQGCLTLSGPTVALVVLAACLLAAAPLGIVLDRKGTGIAPAPMVPVLPLRAVLSGALRHRGFGLLTLGFFTCGFQLAFIATHLPSYLSLNGLSAELAATALALVGLFNILGSWGCGWLGGRLRQHRVLGWLYLFRGAAIALFFLSPKTEASVLLFAAVMGLLWLGTVPLTSGLIARMFGMANLGLLFGICFLSHQVGSFLGAWLGGVLFDLTGSYSAIWGATAIAGLVAAMLHFPIDDAPQAAPST